MDTQDTQTTDLAQPVARGKSWLRLLGCVGLLLLSFLMTASFLRPNQCPTPSETQEKVKVSTSVYHYQRTTDPPFTQDAPPRFPSAGTDEPYFLWGVRHWFFGSGLPLDAASCQEWMAFLQSDATFLALRHPASSPSPMVFQAGLETKLVLQDAREWPFVDLVTVPFELRPERQEFMESQLPSTPGQQWLALGLAGTPAADCSGVPSLAGNEWQFVMSYSLDLGGGPLDGEGEVLPIYYCHQGQDAPFFFEMLGRALDRDAVLTSGQGQGVTYIGPQPVLLTVTGVAPDFDLHSTYVTHITPTIGITLPHWLANWGSEPLTLSLTYTSTLNTSWSIVSGTGEGPQLPLVPITGPITLRGYAGTAEIRYIWLLAQAPEDTAAGAYNLIITATDVTSPAIRVWTSDLLWAGEWVAPPLGGGYWVHLPLVLRWPTTP